MHGLDPERIVCGTGSDELLNLAAQGFAGPQDEVLFSRFSFAVYDIAARRCGAIPVEAPDRDLTADVDALLAAVTERTRVVFLANPNNPTGTFLPPAEVARLHAGLPGDVLLVVDEAYGEYVDPALQTAAFDLAARHAQRAGDAHLLEDLRACRRTDRLATGAPGLIDVLAASAARSTSTPRGSWRRWQRWAIRILLPPAVDHNAKQRARLAEAIGMLNNHGLSITPGEANFLLVHFHRRGHRRASARCTGRGGYAVRHLPGQGLPDALRITIGKTDDMTRVIACLRSLCGEPA